MTARPPPAPSVSAGSGRSVCGQPSVMLHCSEGRIVNGSRACYGQFPWQVGQLFLKLRRRLTINRPISCGFLPGPFS